MDVYADRGPEERRSSVRGNCDRQHRSRRHGIGRGRSKDSVERTGQHNTLKLSLVDVLNLGETDLFQHDGKQQMMVNGKDGDTVDLSNSHIAGLAEGEWEQHGTTQVGGVTYNVYEHSSAHTELLIEHSVRIEML